VDSDKHEAKSVAESNEASDKTQDFVGATSKPKTGLERWRHDPCGEGASDDLWQDGPEDRRALNLNGSARR